MISNINIPNITKYGKKWKTICKKSSKVICCALLLFNIITNNIYAATSGNGTFQYGGYSWLNSGAAFGDSYPSIDGNTIQAGFLYSYTLVSIHLVREYSSGTISITMAGLSGLTHYNIFCEGAQITSIGSSIITLSVRFTQDIKVYIISGSSSYANTNGSVSSMSGSNLSYSDTVEYHATQIDSKLTTTNSTLSSILTQLQNSNTTLSSVLSAVDDLEQYAQYLTYLQSIDTSLMNIDSFLQNEINDYLYDMNNTLVDIKNALDNLNGYYQDNDNIYIDITDLFDDLILDIENLEGVYDINYYQPIVDDEPFHQASHFITHVYNNFIDIQDRPEINSIIIVSIILVIVGWFL